MNHCVPNWDMDGDPKSFANPISSTNQFGSDFADNELVELLWRNGHIVMQSQTHRKPIVAPIETKQPSKCINGSSGSSNHQIESVDTPSWLNYTLDDPLEKDFCSDFFYEMPISDPISSSIKSTKFRIPEETNTLNNSVFKQPTTPHFKDNPMPPPVVKACDGIPNFSHFSRTNKVDLGSSNRENFIRGEAGESSVMTVGSSRCDSNQVQCGLMPSHLMSDSGGTKNTFSGTAKEDASEMQSQSEKSHTEMLEPTVTSSSGGSRGSLGGLGKLTTSNGCQKRKIRDGDESEWHSEEAEYESVEASKQPQRSQSARRSRAAEVHNLSERRRRDRINEKMKALQELIPHCNKSDKASMLDEAIEYLKSLQMQVQILWMGSGMAPMMLPGIQHYMSRMGLGINPAQLPSMNSPSLQMPRIPLVNQSMPSTSTPNQPLMSSATALNPVNFQNPMQNAQYMGFHHIPLGHQLMNLYPYGSQIVQQIQTGALASANVVTSEALDGTTKNVQSGSAGEAKLG